MKRIPLRIGRAGPAWRAVPGRLAIACAVAAAWPAHGAHDAEPQRITVTGDRPSTLPIEIPTTTESITGRAVEERINATDSEDALKYFPSLLVRKRYIGDYDHAVLSTRASGTGNSARSLVYADGILLSNLLGNGASFTPRWGLVTPEEIERVDVLYGPFSAAYPGNSAGAVVDYQTRLPRAFEAHAKIAGFTQAFDLYGTHDRFSGGQASASLGAREGAWSWWVNLNRLDSQGQPLVYATRLASQTAGSGAVPVTGAVSQLNRFGQPWLLLGTSSQAHTQQDHAKVKLAWQAAPGVLASYTAGLWRNHTERRYESWLRDAAGNPVYSGDVQIGGANYRLAPGDFPQTRESLAHQMHGLSLRQRRGGAFDWELAASLYDYTRDQVRSATTAPPAADSGGAGRLTDLNGTGWRTLALKGIWRPGAGDGSGEGARTHVAEFGLQHDAFRLRTRAYDLADWIAGAPGTQTSRFEGRTALTSAWAQDTWRFAPDWRAVLGLRAERWRAERGVTANAASVFAHPERSETFYSPKAAVGWGLSDDWTLKLSTGRAVRMPTVAELYQGGLNALGQLVNGDPGLRPERSQTTEASAEWQRDLHSLRITVFHEATKDALHAQLNAANVNTVQNVDRIRTTGLEVAGQRQQLLWPWLDLAGSVTFADSVITANAGFPASAGKQQPRVPRWRANLLATVKPAAAWTGTLGVRYGGTQFNSLDNSDPIGARYQGASRFLVVDARVRWQVDRQWSAALGVDNLGDRTFWNFHPYPQRTWVAELKFDL